MFQTNVNKTLEGISISPFSRSSTASILEMIDEVLLDVSKKKLKLLLENLQTALPEEEFKKMLSILSSNEPLEEGTDREKVPSELLTHKEDEIVRRLARGQRNFQIAQELFISPHTVRTHRNNIHRKLKICGKKLNPLIFYEKYVESNPIPQ